MILNKYRRKPDVIEMDKENYEKHISKLEGLKSNYSPNFKKLIRQEKKVHKTILRFHECHLRSRKHQQLERNLTENTIKKLNINRIKSVVKGEFTKESFIMPPKHVKKNDQLSVENEKIYERIVKIRPKIMIQTVNKTQRPKKTHHEPLLGKNTTDFSKIFQSSKLNESPARCLKVRLGRAKPNMKITIRVNKLDLMKFFKDKNEIYILEVKCGDKKIKTGYMILQELAECPIAISGVDKMISNGIQMRYIRLFGQKQIQKGWVRLSGGEIHKKKIIYELKKDLVHEKGKKLGEVSIILDIKERSQNKTLIYDELQA